jgi:hypothetical protein
MSSKQDPLSHVVPLEVLGLSRRTYNALKRGNVDSVNALLSLDPDSITRIRGIGSKAIAEIESELARFQAVKGDVDLKSWGRALSIGHTSQKHKGQTALDVLELSRRAYNLLARAGIDSVHDLIAIEPEALLRIRGIGEKTVTEIQDALSRFKADTADQDFDEQGVSATPQLLAKEKQFSFGPDDRAHKDAARILKQHGIEEEPTEWTWSYFLRELQSWEAVSKLESDLKASSLPPLGELPGDSAVGKETLRFLLGINCPLHLISSSRATSDQLTSLHLGRAGICTVLDLCLATKSILEEIVSDYQEITEDLSYYLNWLASQNDWQNEVAGNQPSPVTRIMLRKVSLVQLIKTAIADTSARDWDIFAKRHRLIGNKGEYTLEELGTEFGLTRERIRQVVARKERDLRRKVESDDLLRAVVFICTQVVEEAGVIHVDALVDEIVELIEIDRNGATPALVVLLPKAGGIEYIRPMRVFLSSRIPSELILAIQSNLRLAMRRAKAPVRISALEIEALTGLEQHKKYICERYGLVTAALEYDPELIHVEEDYWGLASWDQRVLDDVVMALRSIGEPTHFKELTRAVNRRLPKDQRTTTRAVHAKLGSYKDLFARTGPGTFALREWDPNIPVQPPKYRDLIKQVLERAGAPLSAEHIYQGVNTLRPAKRSSIVMYLTMHEDFIQLGKDRFGLAQWGKKEEAGGVRVQANLSQEFLDELRAEAIQAFQQQDGEGGNES